MILSILLHMAFGYALFLLIKLERTTKERKIRLIEQEKRRVEHDNEN